MLKTLVKGNAWTPARFWNFVEIDPQKEPEKYTELIKAGYIEKEDHDS